MFLSVFAGLIAVLAAFAGGYGKCFESSPIWIRIILFWTPTALPFSIMLSALFPGAKPFEGGGGGSGG